MRTFIHKLKRIIMCTLGLILAFSLSITISCDSKEKPDPMLLEKAQAGDAQSQYSLANWYASHRQNDNYIEWLTKAAEQGFVDAQYDLAVSYDEGDGTRKRKSLAVKWYMRAIENGDGDASYNLALMYDHGDYVSIDKAKAFQYYLLAAQRGHVKAMHNVGMSYYEGEGVAKDINEALKWLKIAADSGVERSRYTYEVICNELNRNTKETASP